MVSFVSGRSMLANLIDIEEAMVTNACESDEGAAIFFDFAAALPSVEHDMLFAVFRKLRWPGWLGNFIQCLYHLNSCSLVLGGARHDGFTIARGIRQGCPLSPLLFAVASDILLRRIRRLVPAAVTRAYADDTALVHPALIRHLGILQNIFTEYELIAGLGLNVRKTVLVPLFEYDRDTLRQRIHQIAPLWGALPIEGKAKYLGLVVGPERGQHSWHGPFKKFLDRAALWGGMGIGLFNTLLAYQVFICSVVMFIAQLDPLPVHFEDIELKACQSLFPGPKGWFSVDALKDLKSLHFPKSLFNVRCAALAARARVARFEDAAHGGLKVRARSNKLKRIMDNPANARRLQFVSDYAKQNFLFSLRTATSELEAARRRLGQHVSDSDAVGFLEQERSGWQARATHIFATAGKPSAMMHVRKRLDRWSLETLPGHRPGLWLRTLELTSKLLPPRVQACQLRTACNEWATCRRFQKAGGCLFNCPRGEDSIEHYAFCSVFHNLCKMALGLERPPATHCLGDFAGVLPYVLSLPEHAREGGNAKATVAALRAIGVYALYRTHNALRHGMRGADGTNTFRGFVREAVRGHDQAKRLVSVAFKRRRAED